MSRNAGRPAIAVVGVGYVGLTSAACLAHLGLDVTAIDIDENKIRQLNGGSSPIMELGLNQLLVAGLASGRLRFTSDYAATANTDIVLLCLPTPHSERENGPDLSAVRAAVMRLREQLPLDAIIVTKSTVPVGTQRALQELIERPDISVASNPEFLREGTAVSDFLEPDRIVIGADHQPVADRVAGIYRGITAPITFCDPLSAELIKYSANSFLATKLSYINELTRLCDRIGADIESVAEGIGSDPRIGTSFLAPGPGWGGSCFPKDTRALMHLARRTGQYLPVIESAYQSNLDQLDHIADRIQQLCPTRLDRARIAVWGATFKAGTDDTRQSPALQVIDRLIDRDATVVVYDPAAKTDDLPVVAAPDIYAACDEADLLVVLTEWPEFADADLTTVAQRLAGKTIYDTRQIVDPVKAADAGLYLVQLGRLPAA
ncbi:MAG: UDP-glucose dehydrogenase family protein [Acidimicrobiales bacterium]